MRRLISLFMLLLSQAGMPLLAASPRPEGKPNVILIVADDLGSHELGCYGQKKIRTPGLDQMASEGMRFTRFYSGSPVCAPSRCCLMTGKHGGHAWVRDNRSVKPEGQTPLAPSEVTLADLFRRQGYATAAAGKWGLGPPGSEADPIKRGFEHFFGYNCQAHAHNHYPTYLWRDDKRIPLEGNDGGRTGKQHSHDLFEAEALRFIDDNKDRHFFLYLPFTIPHVALQVPEDSLAEYRGVWEDPPYTGGQGYLTHPTPRAAYAAMVTRLDRTVGRILARLREQKLDRDTLVLFTSDNGPTHDRVGGADSRFFESAGQLRGLKGSVYEGGIRVPLIAWRPGTIRAGGTADHVCYFPDVMPTLMDILGASNSLPPGIDGVSFAPTLLGKGEQKKPEYLFWEFPGYGGQQAVLKGDWKGVRQGMQKGRIQIELYHLGKDPSEKTDVAQDHPEVVAQMEKIMATARVSSALFPLKSLDGK